MAFRKLEKGKDWNLKGEIAYGVAGVHDELKDLQKELNHFASISAIKLDVDGFIGPRTGHAVKAIYDAVVKKNPLLAATPFPVPDTKEEVAEYAQFIRDWLQGTAAKTLGVALS
jgi:hypothetical protein